MPRRVHCSPLKRDREVVADVVATEWIADPRGIRKLLTVVVEGHQFRIEEQDVTKIEHLPTDSKGTGNSADPKR